MNHFNRRSLVLGIGLSTFALAAQAATDMPPKGPWTEEGRIERGGMTIHYVGVGRGPAIILLHKLGGWVADWRQVAPFLATGHRVIAIDMPGHGDSVVSSPAPYVHTVAESAAAVMSVVDELGIDRFDIVGNSMGGVCAAVIAGMWPDRVKHLAIISSSIGEGVSREQLATLGGNNYTADGYPIPRSVEAMKDRFGIVDAAVQEEQNASRAKAGRWVLSSARGVARSGSVNFLARATAPTLLLYGEKGAYKEFEPKARAAAKGGRTEYIPNAGSFAHQDNPQGTARALLRFFAEPT